MHYLFARITIMCNGAASLNRFLSPEEIFIYFNAYYDKVSLCGQLALIFTIITIKQVHQQTANNFLVSMLKQSLKSKLSATNIIGSFLRSLCVWHLLSSSDAHPFSNLLTSS